MVGQISQNATAQHLSETVAAGASAAATSASAALASAGVAVAQPSQAFLPDEDEVKMHFVKGEVKSISAF